MKIKPQHVFALALMRAPGAWAAGRANASLDFFNSGLAPLSLSLAIPPRASMTAEAAADWLENASKQIGAFVDSKASLMEQAFEWGRISDSLVIASRNAMIDANAAARLNFYSPPETFAQFRAKWSKSLDGDDSWKKVIAYAKEQTQRPVPGCFVAGTLIHTKEGLRPVEQIKVGDLVLSKPESGQGEQSYQPVTKTFSYENRELYLIAINERDRVTGKPVRYESEHLAVSGSHPIWIDYFRQLPFSDDEPIITPVNAWVTVEEYYLKCWQAALDSLETRVTPPAAYGTLANGSRVVIHEPSRILKGLEADEGVKFSGDDDTWNENSMAKRIRFGARGAELLQGPGSYTHLGDAEEANYDYTGYDVNSPMSLVKLSGGHLPIRRTVYNIEVANTHTYFVGELGLWVHNKNPSNVPPQLPSVAQSPRG